MNTSKLYLSFFLILSFSILVSAQIGFGNLSYGINWKPTIKAGTNINETILNVNNSKYWDGHEWSDTRWLNIDGSNANQDIDITPYDLKVDKLTTTGYVGIGTTSPARPLHVAGSTTFMRADRYGTYGAAWLMTRMSGAGGSVYQSWLFGDLKGIAGNTKDNFGIVDYGTAVGSIYGDTRFVIDKDNGNIGIGTTTPSERLDLGNGNLTTTGKANVSGVLTTDPNDYNFIYPATNDYHRYSYILISYPSVYSVAKKKAGDISTMTYSPNSWGGSELITLYYEKLADPNDYAWESTSEDEAESAGFLFKWKIREDVNLIHKINISVQAKSGENWYVKIWNFSSGSWEDVGNCTTPWNLKFVSGIRTNINDYIQNNTIYVLAYMDEIDDDTFYMYQSFLDVYSDKEVKNETHIGDLIIDGSLKLKEPNTFGFFDNRINAILGKVSISDSNDGYNSGYQASIYSNESGLYVESNMYDNKGIYIKQKPSFTQSYKNGYGLYIYQWLYNAPNFNPYGIYISQSQGKPSAGIKVSDVGSTGNYASYISYFFGNAIGYYVGSLPPSVSESYAYYNSMNNYHNFMGNDNVKTYFGTDKDAYIDWDGNHLIINTTTGNLQIKNGTGWGTIEAHNFVTHTFNSSNEPLEEFTDDTNRYDVWINVTDYSKPIIKTDCYCNFKNLSTCPLENLSCYNYTVYPYTKRVKGQSQGLVLADVKGALTKLNKNIDLDENLTKFDNGIMAEEIYTESKTIKPNKDYFNKFVKNKLENKYFHKNKKTIIFKGKPKEVLDVEDRIVDLEGFAMETKKKIEFLEQENQMLKSELCELSLNKYSWCKK